jgi:sugar phosphate isomerase/epimerase
MHPLGVHSHLFRGCAATVAAEVCRHGLACVQLTPSFPRLSFHEPGQITPDRCRRAAEPFLAAGLRLAALSGGGHLLDPNLDRRHQHIVRWHALIRHCRDFGTDRVATETGSLSTASPWLPHPPNRTAEAWSELCLIVREGLRRAADAGVTLLFKPGGTHVLATVADALRLSDELDHPNLAFVLDPATFLLDSRPEELAGETARLVELLGPRAPLVHVKDLRFDGTGPSTPRAGRGVLDFGLFFGALQRFQPAAPVILEHLRPTEVVATRAYLEPFLTA